MALGNAKAGGSGAFTGADWLQLAQDKDATIVVAFVTQHIAPKRWSDDAKMEPSPGATAHFAFITGPRTGEMVRSETVISAGIVNPLLAEKVGNATAGRIADYGKSRKFPCMNPCSGPELAAVSEALAKATAEGLTVKDADGDTLGDIWTLFERNAPAAADDDEPPF